MKIFNPTNILISYFDEERDVINEKHQVSTSNSIQLQYIPSSTLDISVYDSNKIEIAEKTVDYDNGIITFTNDISRQFITVDYTAIGEWGISSSKVYTNYDNRGNILETLEQLITDMNEIVEQVSVIGDVVQVVEEMRASINNLVALYDAVIHNQEILDNINETIQECILKKDEMVSAINTAISNANDTKNTLITTANNCKSEIDIKVTQSVSTINSTSSTAISNVNTAITNANNTKTQLETSIRNGINCITELEEWVDNNGDITTLDGRVDTLETDNVQNKNNISLKQNKTDNTLMTTSKNIVGAINEIKQYCDDTNVEILEYDESPQYQQIKKYADGRMEIYQVFSMYTAVDTPWGSCFVHNDVGTTPYNYKIPFVREPRTEVSAGSNTGGASWWVVSKGKGTNQHAPIVQICRATTYSRIEWHVVIRAIGRWK